MRITSHDSLGGGASGGGGILRGEQRTESHLLRVDTDGSDPLTNGGGKSRSTSVSSVLFGNNDGGGDDASFASFSLGGGIQLGSSLSLNAPTMTEESLTADAEEIASSRSISGQAAERASLCTILELDEVGFAGSRQAIRWHSMECADFILD